ncbi:hypothetical protein B9M78_21925 [Mycobacteroides abscessus]|nr:hypothetical protein B9M78_21925 [Mycobacteroides abscessus]
MRPASFERVAAGVVIVAICIGGIMIVAIAEMVIVAIRMVSLAGFERRRGVEQCCGQSARFLGGHFFDGATVKVDAPLAECAGVGLLDEQGDFGTDTAGPIASHLPVAHREVAHVRAGPLAVAPFVVAIGGDSAWWLRDACEGRIHLLFGRAYAFLCCLDDRVLVGERLGRHGHSWLSSGW